MKIKWISNSRAKHMAAKGVIDGEDIIPRGSTASYPADTATVAMRDVQSPNPWVSVHIRGEERKKHNYTSPYGGSWIAATTMRVNFGHTYRDLSLSGELCNTLNFNTVHQVVTDVRAAMEA
jgi:hypothetical protein